MKKIITYSMLLLACLYTPTVMVSAQASNTDTHTMVSGYNKKEYQLKVLLPAKYTTSDTVRYPVLYVLDGDYATGMFQSTLQLFSLAPELQEMIIVTIDGVSKSHEQWLASRYYDYTPSSDPKADTAIAGFMKTAVVPSGGADAFLQTLEKQILPWVEQHYKTNADKGLYGHSLGGLFAAYCLLQKPALFRKYSINSPSLWWRQGEMAKQFASTAKADSAIYARVFLSAGKAEGDFMINPIDAFEQVIMTNFPGIKMNYKIFDDETHLSVVPLTCTRTLKTFYPLTASR
ncbi:MAG TPA: alpha/beta hydrolase-fold protein [Panacibacter sp.]|nr:alpha/beta hydrolase-fold protein [Panacibacter sp.]